MKSFANIFGGYGALAEKVMGGFLDFVLKSNMSIADLGNVYSDKLDEVIRKETDNKLKYVGGSFNVYYMNDKYFKMSYELYFQNTKKEWIKKEAKSQPQKMDYLTEEAQVELKREKKISFEIDNPIDDIVKDI